MAYNFDQVIDRRATESAKWHHYGEDLLPLWVADMDFVSPEPVVQALRERAEHGVFGYPQEPKELREVVVEWCARRYGWQIQPDWLAFMPGVVVGFNLACHAVTSPGDGVLIQTPVYPPFFGVLKNVGLELDQTELTRGPDGAYAIDFDAMEAAIADRTRVFLLCNPHNPVGRVFTRAELERMAEMCLRHNLTICSDEIHCDLVFSGQRHIPIASLSSEMAERTITLIAPSKTFNIAGLSCSAAIISSPALRKQVAAAHKGLMSHVNVMGYVAALAAYRAGGEWLDELLPYLEANRDFLHDYVNTQLPGLHMGKPEGTYLAWLDCREAGITGKPCEFFMREAKVALNDGAPFGQGGEGFVRLNFGCPRSTLVQALEQMKAALSKL